jgi:hypothetical protein
MESIREMIKKEFVLSRALVAAWAPQRRSGSFHGNNYAAKDINVV